MAYVPPSAVQFRVQMATYSDQWGAAIIDGGTVESKALLTACEAIYRQMRVGVPKGSAAALAHLHSRLAAEPLQLIIALKDGAKSMTVLGITVVRIYENTFNGTKLLIEAMHTDPEWRSRGVGRAMMNAVKALADRSNAKEVTCQVDSQAARAQRFFMRERLDLQCLAFRGSSAVGARVADAQPSASPAASPASNPNGTIGYPVAAPGGAAFVTGGGTPGFGAGSAPVFPQSLAFDVHVITDGRSRTIAHEGLLRAAERVHRQLRPNMTEYDNSEEYVQRMRRIVADGGQMAVAVARSTPTQVYAYSAPVVLGLVVFRFYTAFLGEKLRSWVDDLVTDSNQRSRGVGAALLESVRLQARQIGVDDVQLDSGVQRYRAHKFYFRENLVVDAFSYGGSNAHLPPLL